MRALCFDGSLRFRRDHPDPVPVEGEVVIRVRLAGICATDLEITHGYMNFRGVPGHEFVGDVVQGPAELRGRRVCGEINCVCGKCDLCQSGLAQHCRRRTVLGIAGRDGAFAELLTLPAQNCHVLPDSITDAAAVFVEPLAAAIQITRQVRLDAKTRVALLGSGRLGLLAAQVLVRTGCRLTVIGRNPATLGRLDRLSIQTRLSGELDQVADFEVVVDCTGSPDGLAMALRLVRPRGTIIMKTTCAAPVPIDIAPLVVNEISLIGSRCGPFTDAITLLSHQAIDVTPFVTGEFSLSRGIEAFEAAAAPESIKVLLRPSE